ncbi:hypothetical protein [Pseudomonas sp. 18175]|uniref:hypothetical protein n=1 Tax=Pseudomonas sp. 18175 TaxID=3390056 RepID=UPI003D25A825
MTENPSTEGFFFALQIGVEPPHLYLHSKSVNLRFFIIGCGVAMGPVTGGRADIGGLRFDTARVGFHSRGAGTAEDIKDGATDKKDEVVKLLRELDDAQATGKSQTVLDLRDKLIEMRKELGDETFKAMLEQLKRELATRWLELLKQLFPDLFADTPAPPSPRPSIDGGGGGGGGGRRGGGGGSGRVNPADFGTVEDMSTKPFTNGARYTNYDPDKKTEPGKAPATDKTPGNIWSGFKQGPDGNCTTVAAIKAAMMKFGQKPTDIFESVRRSGDGYAIKMRDEFPPFHLSKSELQQAAQQARFLGDDPEMMTDANFLYAASAKRAQIEGNQGWGHGNDHNAQRSYLDALVSLNDGEMLREGLDRLGLKGLYKDSSSNELANGELGVVAYGGHAMAVIGGHVELWGGRGGRPSWGEAYAFTKGNRN